MRAAIMKERPDFPLMRQTDVQHIYHMQMPRWLFSDSRYADMNLDTKVAYTFLLNRFQLSRRNGWVNDRGEVFVIFPRKELARELRICEQRVTAAFRQLAARKLIWEKRCGRGDANQIYLASVEPTDDPAYTCAPFLDAAGVSRSSRVAKSEVFECSEGNRPLQEPQDPLFLNNGSESSRTAETAVAEPQSQRPSYIDPSEIDPSHMEISLSAVPDRADEPSEEEMLTDILDACELYTFEPEIARIFENAIERLFYSDSFRVGNVTLPKSRVRSKLRRLDGMVLRAAESKLHANLTQDVKNSTAYTMAVIFNCITECEGDLLVDPYLNSLRDLSKEADKMLLTVQQKYILDILKKLQCLRAEQLRRLVAARFRHPDLETSRRRMSAMLRQLSTFQREVSLKEEFICYDGAQPDLRKLEAIDVMLELTKDAPDDFTAQVKSPLQLRFLWGGDKLRLFTVISFSAVGVTGTYSERQRSERVIWISDNGAMPENLSLPSKHFFAVRQSDGSHRFYGSSEP